MPSFGYVDLRPHSGFRIPVRASTLWGHLAWAMRELEGRPSLVGWIRAHEEAIEKGLPPPLRLSSAFPRGFLPRPLLPPAPVKDTATRKTLKALGYIPIEVLPELFKRGEEALLALVPPKASPPGDALRRKPRTRVAMSRLTGAAAEGLLFEEALYWSKDVLRVYFELGPGEDKARILALFDHLATIGYGGGASIGNGAFSIESIGEEMIEGGRGPYHLLLGPALLPPDPVGWWRTERYWGRLGSFYANAPVPFKRPYLRVVEGSVLKNYRPRLLDVTPAEAPESEVRIVENLAPLTLPLEVPHA